MLNNFFSTLLQQLLNPTPAGENPTGVFSLFTGAKLKRMLWIAAGLTFSFLIFFAGVISILADLLWSTHQNGALGFTEISAIGASLCLVSLLSSSFLLSTHQWKISASQPRPPGTWAESPLQQAVADLIQDFVLERRLDRELKLQSLAATSGFMVPETEDIPPSSRPAVH